VAGDFCVRVGSARPDLGVELVAPRRGPAADPKDRAGTV
jgi:hypothetical protein